MHRALLAALLFASMATAADDDALVGRWTVVAAERNGQAADDVKGHVLTLAGNRFTIKSKDGQVVYEGTFTRDPAKTPATIDFVHTAGSAKGKTWLGIWKLEATKLTICDNAPDPSQPRPTAFATKPDSGHTLVRLERSKP